MSALYREILTGLVFMIGVAGFITGEFIVSTVLFAIAAITSNVNLNRQCAVSY